MQTIQITRLKYILFKFILWGGDDSFTKPIIGDINLGKSIHIIFIKI